MHYRHIAFRQIVGEYLKPHPNRQIHGQNLLEKMNMLDNFKELIAVNLFIFERRHIIQGNIFSWIFVLKFQDFCLNNTKIQKIVKCCITVVK